MKKRTIAELLKIYSADLELLTSEECARLHQHASDQEKLYGEMRKVMYDLLINEHSCNFPKLLGGRTATINTGAKKAPSNITWSEISLNNLPIDKPIFMECATMKVTTLKEQYPATYKKLSQSEWFAENTSYSSGYITWSKPIKKIEK
jgi:hypothetical protein